MDFNPHLQTKAVARHLDTMASQRVGIEAAHGRGESPGSMIDLLNRLGWGEFPAIAPAAHGQTWYPNKFMTDIRENQPFLNYAHQAVDEAVKAFLQEGLARHEIVLMGYSQGGRALPPIMRSTIRHVTRQSCVLRGD